MSPIGTAMKDDICQNMSHTVASSQMMAIRTHVGTRSSSTVFMEQHSNLGLHDATRDYLSS